MQAKQQLVSIAAIRARVSRSFNEVGLSHLVDGPGWDEAEALVAVACSTHNLALCGNRLLATSDAHVKSPRLHSLCRSVHSPTSTET
jgi:hypothetical protein